MCDLDWEDTMKYNIEDEDFCHVIEFVDNARKHGSVLVHCAQVCFDLYFDVVNRNSQDFRVLIIKCHLSYLCDVHLFIHILFILLGKITIWNSSLCISDGKRKYGDVASN